MTLLLPEPTIELQPDSRPPWRIVLGALLAAMAIVILTVQAAVVAELLQDDVWLVSSDVEFRDPNLLPETVAVTLESPSVWHPIAVREGISDTEFTKNYAVSIAGGGTQILRITYEDTDADRGQRIVRGVVDNYLGRFRGTTVEPDETIIREHLAGLEALESDLAILVQNNDGVARAVQIDQQNQLVKVRQQITSVLLRLDNRESTRANAANLDPRLVTDAFVAEEPITPNPKRAVLFGGAAGGLIAVGVVFLAFHRTAQNTEQSSGPGNGGGYDRSFLMEPSAAQRWSDPMQEPMGSWAGRVMKRGIDISVAGIVLVVLSPVLLVVALAIRLTSKGPALFRQERVGQFGSPFTMYKFRTMTVDNDDSEHRAYVKKLLSDTGADPNASGAFKLQDRRVTGVGVYLRRFSVDELPQLWNVLRGDMSLVGPRPALPWEWDILGGQDRYRMRALPGCTGLWQVSGRNLVTAREMLALDVDYVRTWSVRRDLAILLRTPLAVLRGDGAR